MGNKANFVGAGAGYVKFVGAIRCHWIKALDIKTQTLFPVATTVNTCIIMRLHMSDLRPRPILSLRPLANMSYCRINPHLEGY